MIKNTYIVYKTTNRVNLKYYIGVHKQNQKEFDNYYGSGKALKRAIKKYGIQNFNRETLYTFYDIEDAYNKEKELLKFIYKLDECYNMRPGGRGTRGKICSHSEEWRKKISIANKGKKHSKQTIEKYRNIDRRYMKSDDYRKKMSLSKKGKTTKLKGKRGFPKTSIMVKTPLGTFSSLREVSDKLKITLYFITKWAKK